MVFVGLPEPAKNAEFLDSVIVMSNKKVHTQLS